MAVIIIGEAIWYNEWVTDQYVEYEAICRVAPASNHDELNLTWFNENAVAAAANNVKNIEDSALGATESYWRRRFSDDSLGEIGNSYLDTVREEKGAMVLYRKWDNATGWATAFYGVIVATLGSPSDEHPKINSRYIDENGTSTLVPTLSPFEKYTDEDDAQGNDLWSNIPIQVQSA